MSVLTVEGRNWLKEQHPELLKNYLVCDRGWLDNIDGGSVSDEFILTELLQIVPANAAVLVVQRV